MDRTRECFGADSPNLVAEKTKSRANTTHTITAIQQEDSAINPRQEFVWGKVGRRDTIANPRKGRMDCGGTTLTTAS
jgi:hypothetical protein